MIITKQAIQYLLKAKEEFDKAHQIIINRVTEVLYVISLCFRKRLLDGWWFPDATEGEVGTFLDARYGDSVQYETRDGHDFDTKYSKGCNYNYEFPYEFLFMDDDKIRERILKEIELGKQEKEENKKKRELYQENRNKLINQAVKKLSKEERIALGYK